jgi:glutamate-1-semialdehyde 2,1-aminomutase
MSRFNLSEIHLSRAEKTIPLGSQTFSKSRTQYPVGVSPLYIERANGCRVWDVDDNEFIDLVSSLASVTLGYNDRAVNRAVKKQLKSGVSFSLPGKLEAEVAELIVELVPSAEMVRFGKNGTDATSAAIRLARAYTGKDHVAVCGYHGWQDWYIGSTTRNKGVPKDVSKLTHNFPYNDLQFLRHLLETNNEIACVIMEPMNIEFPTPGYLEGVRALTNKHGVVLIFDETITGFRFAKGGAQQLFNVIPDLSTFGKGIANGFPLSAVVGKREIMLEMENIFFSGTFGGELLSLAAAKHVLQMHLSDSIVPRLIDKGNSLAIGTEAILSKYNLNNTITLSGHESWKFLNWKSNNQFTIEQMKTFFLQEVFAKGLLVLGTHNITLSHSDTVIDKILNIYDETFFELAMSLESENLASKLKVEPIVPLFKIR